MENMGQPIEKNRKAVDELRMQFESLEISELTCSNNQKPNTKRIIIIKTYLFCCSYFVCFSYSEQTSTICKML